RRGGNLAIERNGDHLALGGSSPNRHFDAALQNGVVGENHGWFDDRAGLRTGQGNRGQETERPMTSSAEHKHSRYEAVDFSPGDLAWRTQPRISSARRVSAGKSRASRNSFLMSSRPMPKATMPA